MRNIGKVSKMSQSICRDYQFLFESQDNACTSMTLTHLNTLSLQVFFQNRLICIRAAQPIILVFQPSLPVCCRLAGLKMAGSDWLETPTNVQMICSKKKRKHRWKQTLRSTISLWLGFGSSVQICFKTFLV